MIISLKELAKCLGLTTRRINQLAKTGVVVLADGQRGKYDLAASVQGYIEFSHAEKSATVYPSCTNFRFQEAQYLLSGESQKLLYSLAGNLSH